MSFNRESDGYENQIECIFRMIYSLHFDYHLALTACHILLSHTVRRRGGVEKVVWHNNFPSFHVLVGRATTTCLLPLPFPPWTNNDVHTNVNVLNEGKLKNGIQSILVPCIDFPRTSPEHTCARERQDIGWTIYFNFGFVYAAIIIYPCWQQWGQRGPLLPQENQSASQVFRVRNSRLVRLTNW